mgnify:CR=1 FL=1
MALKFFKTFEKDSLADGGTYEDSWVIDQDVVIRRIYIRAKDGTELNNSTFYFKISENVYTHSVVPAGVLGESRNVSPELNIPFNKGEKLSFTFKNNEGATKSIFICFECVEKE